MSSSIDTSDNVWVLVVRYSDPLLVHEEGDEIIAVSKNARELELRGRAIVEGHDKAQAEWSAWDDTSKDWSEEHSRKFEELTDKHHTYGLCFTKHPVSFKVVEPLEYLYRGTSAREVKEKIVG